MAIEWAKKKRGGASCAHDKEVYVSSTTSGRHTVASITFRRGVEERITTSGYMVAGIEGGRLYFSGASAKEGYKIAVTGGGRNCSTKCLRVNDERLARICEKCKGGYNLEYDRIEGLYFITLKKTEGAHAD